MKNNTYSISEVAKILGLKLKATRRMVAAGQIETIKMNNTYRVDKEYFDTNIETIKSKSVSIENTPFKETTEIELPTKQKRNPMSLIGLTSPNSGIIPKHQK